MKVLTTKLEGIILIETRKHVDKRGFFLECYEKNRYEKIGIAEDFPQDNQSRSKNNVLRGLHFTKKNPQSQILTVMRGKIFDVVVDIRAKSSTFGKWYGVELSDEGLNQIYMPYGFAHGYYVLSEYADLHYKVSQRYDPADEGGLLWSDSDLGINWPTKNPLVSSRDGSYQGLKSQKNYFER